MKTWISKVLGVMVASLAWVALSTGAGEANTVLASPGTIRLETGVEMTLPPSLYRKPPPSLHSNNAWSQFEANHAVTEDSGFLAEPFYHLCVTVQQLKLWQTDVHQIFHEFDRGMNETFFGFSEPPNSRHQTTDDAFFGKPRFQTILPLDDEVSMSKHRSRLAGQHNHDSTLIGIRIVIPFGSK